MWGGSCSIELKNRPKCFVVEFFLDEKLFLALWSLGYVTIGGWCGIKFYIILT